MTDYYIDLNSGDDTKDGLSTGNAWKTIDKFTENARSPGDRVFVRANTTQTCTSKITFTSNGTMSAFIEIIGCDSNIDPWGDGSDVTPIIDFDNNASYYIEFFNWKQSWKFTNLTFQNCPYTYGMVRIENCRGVKFVDCNFLDCYMGCRLNNATACFEGCDWNSGSVYQILALNSYMIMTDCSLDNGQYGLALRRTDAIMENVVMGETIGHSVADIDTNVYEPCKIWGRNVKLLSSTPILNYTSVWDNKLLFEDWGQVKGAQRAYHYDGIINKENTIIRSGGADSSVKVEPNTNCCSEELFKCIDIPIKVANEETTVTVYVRSLGAWSSYPTSDELYLDVSYYNGATSKRVDSTHSVQVLSDESTWVAFTTTFTPSSESNAYVRIWIGKYEASKGIYVDPLIKINGNYIRGISWEYAEPIVRGDPVDFPSENDVENGVDFDNGDKTGNLQVPTEGNVKKDIGYGSNGTEHTGTLESTDPGESNVIKDVTYKIESVDKTGTFDESIRNTDPGESNVEDGVTYKIQNSDKEGNLEIPSEADVRDGEGYGSNGTEKEGVLDLPSEDDVRKDTQFDNVTKTGKLNLPSIHDVEEGVTFDQETKEGDLELPVEANVKLNTEYGYNGEFTGTLQTVEVQNDISLEIDEGSIDINLEVE